MAGSSDRRVLTGHRTILSVSSFSVSSQLDDFITIHQLHPWLNTIR